MVCQILRPAQPKDILTYIIIQMKQLLFSLMLLVTVAVSAQRYKIISGKLDNLKGITEYHVTLDKAGMVVHGFDSEVAFVNAKVEKRKQHKDTL